MSDWSQDVRRYESYGKFHNPNEKEYYDFCKLVMDIIKKRVKEGNLNTTHLFSDECLGSDKKPFSNTHNKNLIFLILEDAGFGHDFYFSMRITKHRLGLLTEEDGPFMGPKEYYKKQKEVIRKCVERYAKEGCKELTNE